MTFYVSTLVSILTDNLKLILADAEAKLDMDEEGTKPRLLVFNSGCHDLAFNDSAMYMSEFKEAFKLLQEIKDTGMFKVSILLKLSNDDNSVIMYRSYNLMYHGAIRVSKICSTKISPVHI